MQARSFAVLGKLVLLPSKPIDRWRDAMRLAGYEPSDHAGVFHFSRLASTAGDKSAAACAYLALLAECPDNKDALEGISYLLQIQGRSSEALEYRRRRLRVHARDLGLPSEAQSDAASYLLSAETGDKPPRAPEAYVEGLFDTYASSFDEHLLDKLAYRVPALLLSEFEEHLPNTDSLLNVLDIGCGTGLAGQAFRPLARRLDGFDLSRRMLALARKRDVYDDLAHGDLIALLMQSDRRYDLVVAADVLPYFGDLYPLFEAVASVLNDPGTFLFSVEKGGSPFRLGTAGRYQHSAEYLQSCAVRAGFRVLSQKEGQLRKQFGRPVTGYLTILRKQRPSRRE